MEQASWNAWARYLPALQDLARLLQESEFTEADVFRCFRHFLEKEGLHGWIGRIDTLSARLFLCTGDTGENHLDRLVESESEGGIFELVEGNLLWEVVDSGKALYVPDHQTVFYQADPDLELETAHGIPAVYCPLRLEGATWGISAVYGKNVTEADLSGLETFAGLISAALEKARRPWVYHSFKQKRNDPEDAVLHTESYPEEPAYPAELARTEDELQRLRAFHEDVLRNVAEGIVLEDTDGYITFANPAAAILLGYTLEELLGKHWKEFVPPELHGAVEAADARRQAGISDRYELELLRKDGKRICVLVSGRPCFRHETFIGSLAVFTDITGNKRTEAALLRKAKELTALHAVLLDILAPHELPALLTTIVKHAIRLLTAAGGGLYLCETQREELRLYVECYEASQDFTGTVLKYGEGAAGQVAQTGKPLIIDDYRQWAKRAKVFEREKPYTAVLSVPLIWHGEVTGVLQVMDDVETRRYSQHDLRLLSLFADQAAIAIENARLFEAERNIRRQAETLREVGSLLTSRLNLDEVLESILDLLGKVVSYDSASIQLVDQDGVLHMAAGRGFPDIERVRQIVRDLSAHVFETKWSEARSQVIPDTHKDSTWITVPGTDYIRSWVGAPLFVKGRFIGSLNVESRTANDYDETIAETVSAFANQAAIAIENARLFEAEHVARERAEALHDAARIIGSTLSLDQLLQAVLKQLSRVLHFDSGCIMLVENDQIAIKVWQGFDAYIDPSLISGMGFDAESELAVSEVVRSGKPVALADVHNDPRWLRTEVGDHVRSWLGVPLWVRDQVIGLFSLDWTVVSGFTDDEISLVQTFALHASAAIQNARLFEAEEQRAAELLAVRQASLSVTASLELEAVLDKILESTLKFLPGAQNAYIFLYQEGEQGLLIFGAALYRDGLKGIPLDEPRRNGMTYSVARSGQSIVVPDMRTHSLYADVAESPGWDGAIVGIPLKIGQRVVGVMNVSYSRPRTFKEAELRVLSLMGDQAAIAIDNASLFERAAMERRHLRLLYDLGRELATSLDHTEILSRAITLTCEALGGLVGEALLYDPANKSLKLCGLYGRQVDSLEELNARLNLTLGKGLVGWVALNNQAVYIPDVANNPHWLPVPELDAEVRSAIVAPILDKERLLGVFSVLRQQPAAFTDDHLELLKTICQQVGLALSNAERYQQVQNLADMLAAERYRLESLIERLPVGVLLLDQEHRLLVANPIGLQILDKLKAREKGDAITHLGPFSLGELIARYNDPLPVEILLGDISRSIIEAEVRPIGGEMRQWVLTLRDVTQERENLEAIKIQERLATVGQLAAGIAHDFNNIMAAILVYTDLLMGDGNLAPVSLERLGIIQQQVQRAASLIRQILDFSRRSVMEQCALDLQPFLKEFSKLLSRVLPETIRIRSGFQSGVFKVNADPVRLQQVFMNLAVNARDAMPDGGDLKFELSRVQTQKSSQASFSDLPAGEWVRIKVSDTGAGILPEHLANIFDPFFTTKPVGQGTGLGLAQVYGIVKQHDGHIEVSSKVGEGTTFTVYLPALPVSEDDPMLQENREHIDGSGVTVLVVEDDPTTREAIEALLRANRFRVLAAPNGVQALRIYDQNGGKISLVLTDLVMPEMGGVPLYQALLERNPEMKVLFMTGHPLDRKNHALLEKGDVRWLQKPFSVQELVQTLRAMLD